LLAVPASVSAQADPKTALLERAGWDALTAGRAHVCALLDTGDVRCWGDNGQGQLGLGDANTHSVFLDASGVVDLGTPAP